MDITIPESELVRLGRRLRGAHLVTQAGYTLGIASTEEGALEALVGDPRLLEDVAAAQAEVSVALGDRELLRTESKELTAAQDAKVAEAKVWRRKVVTRGQRVRRLGVALPEVLTVIRPAPSVARLLSEVTTILANLEAKQAEMGGETAAALLEEGRRLNLELGQIDAAQEATRGATLSEAQHKFALAKARLYLGVKVINDAGRELHAADPLRASRYNLTILHRRARRSPASPSEPNET